MDENGFWLERAGVGNVELKTLLPRFGSAVSGFGFTGGAGPFAVVFGFPTEAFATLMPLMALIVPSFLRHAFLLQLKMYNFRSCPGNLSGRSPFNCNSSAIILVHILHLARSAEGALFPSSHT